MTSEIHGGASCAAQKQLLQLFWWLLMVTKWDLIMMPVSLQLSLNIKCCVRTKVLLCGESFLVLAYCLSYTKLSNPENYHSYETNFVGNREAYKRKNRPGEKIQCRIKASFRTIFFKGIVAEKRT